MASNTTEYSGDDESSALADLLSRRRMAAANRKACEARNDLTGAAQADARHRACTILANALYGGFRPSGDN